jgi:alpha-ribazole phosphatase
MTRIFLIRHGETKWNKVRKYQGQTDIALSEAGRRQADCLAGRLRTERFAAAYSSDLVRANETAKTIAAPHGLEVRVVTGLKEISFGAWEGMTHDSLIGEAAEEANRFFSQPLPEAKSPGGESFRQLQERMQTSLEEIVSAHPGEDVLVVSHGAAIRSAICAALDIPLSQVWNIRQDNTALNILEYHGERTVVARINDATHLQEEKQAG